MTEATVNDTVTEPTVTVQVSSTTVTLLGTAHVSRASAEEVVRRIASGSYDAVALELCPSRYRALVEPEALAELDLFRVIKTGQAPMIVASLVLGAFQQRIAEQFGIEPGAEMRAAIDAAEGKKLPVHLVDREVGITLRRAYRGVPWWQRLYLIAALFTSVFSRESVSEEEIETLKQGDILDSAFNEFADRSQALFKPLIEERDEYMAARIFEELRHNHRGNLLVIIGAGHLKGVGRYLEEGIAEPSDRIRDLAALPPRRGFGRLLPWLIVVLVFLGFFIGFSRSPELGLRLITEWVLINGGLSALGAALAGGHGLTVLSAFLAAPLTSLNPTIGAGMVTGLVEVALRRPTVGDFSALRHDTAHYSGWRHNRVARAFLVFVFSTVGSAIGTYVAGLRIIELLR
jgi:pheromone shutdown-related protein TraB